MCARHYDKMYAVSRVPGKTVDHLDNYGEKKGRYHGSIEYFMKR